MCDRFLARTASCGRDIARAVDMVDDADAREVGRGARSRGTRGRDGKSPRMRRAVIIQRPGYKYSSDVWNVLCGFLNGGVGRVDSSREARARASVFIKRCGDHDDRRSRVSWLSHGASTIFVSAMEMACCRYATASSVRAYAYRPAPPARMRARVFTSIRVTRPPSRMFS